MTSLTLTLPDVATLRALYERDLSKGRVFVPDATGVGPLEACELTIAQGARAHVVRAEVVFVKEEGVGRGVGLQLLALDAQAAAALKAFVEEEPDEEPASSPERPEGGEYVGMHERIRGLSHLEQQRLAAGGTLPERVVLERTFGANVWESLLGNARLTIPEVARIARKGMLSKPLVESIAGHPAWLAAPEVQRALLSNPRSTPGVVTRVLQVMSRADLVLVPQQTTYPPGVRAAAKRMLGK